MRKGGKQMNLKFLRKKYPQQVWTAIRVGFNSYAYESADGWHAHWVSRLTPRYDGDDETCRSEFWVYPKDGVPVREIGLL